MNVTAMDVPFNAEVIHKRADARRHRLSTAYADSARGGGSVHRVLRVCERGLDLALKSFAFGLHAGSEVAIVVTQRIETARLKLTWCYAAALKLCILSLLSACLSSPALNGQRKFALMGKDRFPYPFPYRSHKDTKRRQRTNKEERLSIHFAGT